MIRNEREITIDAPRERVYAYLTDFARHPEWAEPKHHLRLQPPSAVKVGATFTSVGKDFGRDSHNRVTITEVVPNERLVFEADQDDGTLWRNTYRLHDGPTGGTRLSKEVRSLRLPLAHRVLFTLLAPIVNAEAAGTYARDLQRIKTRIEGAAPATATATTATR